MKKNHKSLMIIVCALFFVALSFGAAMSADIVTISGTVNDYYGIETDDGEEPQLRACLRGRAFRQRVYAPDRLKFPMRRVGVRG